MWGAARCSVSAGIPALPGMTADGAGMTVEGEELTGMTGEREAGGDDREELAALGEMGSGAVWRMDG